MDVLRLFEHLYWIRDRCLVAAGALSTEAFVDASSAAYRDLRGTLVHELDVERSWRLRLQGADRSVWDVTLEASDYPDVASLAGQWQDDEGDMLAWLEDLTEANMAAPVTVNGLEGFALSTYLVHVVMHGIDSLSAAAILLDRAGTSIGDVGYLDFIDSAGEARPAAPS